jgi:hypothetical protein
MTRPDYQDPLHRTGLLRSLSPYDPHVIGTLPLGIARPDSDIDIVCCAPEPSALATLIWERFRDANGFAIYQWSARGRPVIARFEAYGWPFEIFAGSDPVHQQSGWRHFEVERRLLGLAGPAFRDALMVLRSAGAKTEPAFASLLGLADDPYGALSDLFDTPDTVLGRLLGARGFMG